MAIGEGNGRKVQVRTGRRDGWTKAVRLRFLEVLAVTCSAAAAARAVGKSDRAARALRERDGDFALLWEQALATGYERLEEELLAHSLGLPTGDHPAGSDIGGGATAGAPVFDPALAMKVLQLRAGMAGQRRRTTAASGPIDQAAIDGKLLERLDALADRVRSR